MAPGHCTPTYVNGGPGIVQSLQICYETHGYEDGKGANKDENTFFQRYLAVHSLCFTIMHSELITPQN